MRERWPDFTEFAERAESFRGSRIERKSTRVKEREGERGSLG